MKKTVKSRRDSSAAERLPLAEDPGSNPGRGYLKTEFFLFGIIILLFYTNIAQFRGI